MYTAPEVPKIWVLVILGKLLRKIFSKTESSLIKNEQCPFPSKMGCSFDKRPLYCPVVRSVLGKARWHRASEGAERN